MNQQILSVSRNVITPVGAIVIDGNGKPFAAIYYRVDDDTVKVFSVVQGGQAVFPQLLQNMIVGNYQKRQEGRLNGLLVRLNPTRLLTSWIMNRTTEARNGQCLLECSRYFQEDDYLFTDHPPIVVNQDHYEDSTVFRNRTSTPSQTFTQLYRGHHHPFNANGRISETSFERMPLETIEYLLPNLDGSTIVAMFSSSSNVAKLMYECIKSDQYYPVEQFRAYFDQVLNHETAIQIMRSFDSKYRVATVPEMTEKAITYKDIFLSYVNQRRILLDGLAVETTLRELNTMVMNQFHPFNDGNESFYFKIGCADGGTFYCCIFPFPSNEIEDIHLFCTNQMHCEGATIQKAIPYSSKSFYLASKVVNVPVNRFNKDEIELPDVDRILVAVSTEGIVPISILGDLHSPGCKMRFEIPLKPISSDADYVFEVYKNVFVLWIDPVKLLFTVLMNDYSGTRYAFYELYNLEWDGMTKVFEKIMLHRSNYIAEIREYRGIYPYELRGQMGFSFYMYQTGQPVCYGISFISHLYGVETFKPGEFVGSIEMESVSPRYYASSIKDQLSLIGDDVLSCKGHGFYVFVNERAISVSWDGETWIYSTMDFSWIQELLHMRTIEILSDEMFVISVNEYLQLYNVSVTVNQPEMVNGFNRTDPVMSVVPLRRVKLGFSPLQRQIVNTEYEFDQGHPSFVVTTTSNRNDGSTPKVGKKKKPNYDDITLIKVEFQL